MREIIIFGAGDRAKRLIQMIDSKKFIDLSDFEVVALCDNNKTSGSYFYRRPVIRPKKLKEYPNVPILISSCFILDEIMEQLLKMSINNPVYFIPEYSYKLKWGGSSMPALIRMNVQKPRLPYLEVSIFAKCNLNCRGCSAASNISEPWHMTLTDLERQFDALKNKYSGIKYLKLLGGEPLLNPEIKDLLLCSRRYWPDAEIVVHSNGLLVPNIDVDILKTMEQLDISFVFTLYPETGKKQMDIENRLREYGVDYYFRKPLYKFYKVINPKGDYDDREVYANCGKCINLRNGKLSCGFDTLIDIIERKYGISICNNKNEHTIDLYNTDMNGWEINALLDSPYSLCRYCAFMRWNDLDVAQTYDWEPFVRGELEDWLIDDASM